MRKEWTPKKGYRTAVSVFGPAMSEDIFVGDVKGVQGVVKPLQILFFSVPGEMVHLQLGTGIDLQKNGALFRVRDMDPFFKNGIDSQDVGLE